MFFSRSFIWLPKPYNSRTEVVNAGLQCQSPILCLPNIHPADMVTMMGYINIAFHSLRIHFAAQHNGFKTQLALWLKVIALWNLEKKCSLSSLLPLSVYSRSLYMFVSFFLPSFLLYLLLQSLSPPLIPLLLFPLYLCTLTFSLLFLCFFSVIPH